jgi:hypothetical protein
MPPTARPFHTSTSRIVPGWKRPTSSRSEYLYIEDGPPSVYSVRVLRHIWAEVICAAETSQEARRTLGSEAASSPSER